MKAYLRDGCPYSFKLLLFVSEAGHLDDFDIVRCDPDGADYERVKQKLAAATGRKATFPTVEIEPGVYKSDSDALVAHYAAMYHIDPKKLPVFSFYLETIYPQLTKQHGG